MTAREVTKFFAVVNGERKELCRVSARSSSELTILVPQPLSLGLFGGNDVLHGHISVHGGSIGSAGTLIKETKQTQDGLIENALFVRHTEEGWCVPALISAMPDLRIGFYNLKEKSRDKLVHVTTFDARRSTLVLVLVITKKPFEAPNVWPAGWSYISRDFGDYSIGLFHLYSQFPSTSVSHTLLPLTSLPRIDKGPISQQPAPFYGFQQVREVEQFAGKWIGICLENQHMAVREYFAKNAVAWTPELELLATHVLFRPTEEYD